MDRIKGVYHNSIKAIFFVLGIVIIPFHLTSQCTLTENIPINDLDENSVSLIISGAVNDDLSNSNQGLCGILIEFQHEFIGDLGISLTSPSGQTVMLTGPIGIFGNSNFTSWNISFNRCSDPVTPDPGYNATFDNSDPWGLFGNFTGSYYPFNGCLEDFNTGPVNGNWTLSLEDAIQFGDGDLISITLIFCDPTGLDCEKCDADAADLNNLLFETCEGDSILNLNLFPVYEDEFPDPNDYDYIYTLARDSQFLEYLSIPDLRDYEPGNYTICGLSYLSEDVSLLPDPLDGYTVQELIGTINNDDQILCADITSECAEIIIYPQADTTYLNEVICPGSSFTVGESEFMNSGTYTVVIPQQPCDSIVVLNLSIPQSDAEIVPSALEISCTDDNIILDGSGSVYENSATFEWTSINGIIVGPTDELSAVISEPGIYTLTIEDRGCFNSSTIEIFADETIPTAALTAPVMDCTGELDSIQLTILTGDVISFEWSGPNNYSSDEQNAKITEAGIYTVILTAANGCTNTEGIEAPLTQLRPSLGFVPEIFTCRDSEVLIQVSTTDDDVSYSWTGPNSFVSDVRSPYVPEPGYYYLESRGANNCPRIDTIEVLIDDELPVLDNIEGGSISCLESSVRLLVDPRDSASDFDYSWTGPNGFTSQNRQPIVFFAGTYCVTITRKRNGCQIVQCVEVVNDEDLPEIDLTGGIIDCQNPVLQLQLSTNASNPVFLWTGPNFYTSEDEDPFVEVAGLYQVAVIDEFGCVGRDSIEVFYGPDIPDVSLSTSNFITCLNDSVDITADAPSDYEFEWTGPASFESTEQNITVSEDGTYTVMVSDNMGCSGTFTINVVNDIEPIELEIRSNDFLCGTDSVDIRVSSEIGIESITITGPGAFVSTDSTTRVGEPGVYIIEASGQNGCIRVDSLIISNDNIVPSVEVEDQFIGCNGNSILLNVETDILDPSFFWRGPNNFTSNLQNPSVVLVGEYIVEVTGPNGCTNTDALIVSVDTMIPAAQIIGSGVFTCDNPILNLESSTDISNPDILWVGPSQFESSEENILATIAGEYILTISNPITGCESSDTLNVGEDLDFPEIVLTGDTLDCVTPDPILSAITEGNVQNPSWTGPNNFSSSEFQINPSEPGTYYFEITGENGCTSVDSTVFVIDTILPILTAVSIDTLTCDITNVQLGVLLDNPELAQFSWTGPVNVAPEQEPIVDVPGQYILTVTMPNQCTAELAYSVIQDIQEPDMLIIGEEIDCQTSKASLEVQSNTEGATISWTGPNNYMSEDFETVAIDTGLYTAIVTGPNGCTSSDSYFVNTDVDAPSVVGEGGSLPCNDNPLMLLANSPNSDIGYRWFGPNSFFSEEQNPEVTEVGEYVVVATAPNGCIATDTVLVDDIPIPPEFALSGGAINCNNQSVDLIAIDTEDDESILWTGPGSFMSNEVVASTQTPGSYNLLVTGTNGCTDEMTIEVGIDTLSPNVIIELQNLVACNNYSAIIDALASDIGPNFELLWTTSGGNILSNAQDPIIDVEGIGTYSLQITNLTNGCITTESIVIEEMTSDLLSFDAEIMDPSCEESMNGSITLSNFNGGQGPYEFSIDGIIFSPNSTFDNLGIGIYNVIMMDQNGCLIDTIVELEAEYELTVDLGPDITVNAGQAFDVTAITEADLLDLENITWEANSEIPCMDCLEFSTSLFNNDIFSIQIEDNNGCMASDQMQVTIISNEGIYIPNAFSPNRDGRNDVLFIYATPSVQSISSFSIFDRWGNRVFEVSDVVPGESGIGWDGTINGADAEVGVYAFKASILLFSGETIYRQGSITLVR